MKKGQLLSLDLLLSLIIITASTGMLLHWTEEQSVLFKEKQSQAQALQVAELAANNLVADKRIVCESVDPISRAHLAFLNNCVPVMVGTIWAKRDLGMPSDFECMLEDHDPVGNNNITQCPDFSQSTLNGLKNYYSVTRQVAYYHSTSREITSDELLKCKNGDPACVLAPGQLTLYVWNLKEN